MPLDSSHQHSSADIMQSDNPHTPIVTGTAQQVSRLGPFAVAWNTPGLNDPVNFGPVVLVIAGFFPSSTGPSAGTANIYALIATPA